MSWIQRIVILLASFSLAQLTPTKAQKVIDTSDIFVGIKNKSLRSRSRAIRDSINLSNISFADNSSAYS